jgi:UDP:flavonoid glycosyltransferase YjiC (YdhE family)
MPYSHDQPDNARRMRRLKVARVIRRGEYTPLRVARKLRQMLEEPKYARRAQSVARMLMHEDGVRKACDALEDLWMSPKKTASNV